MSVNLIQLRPDSLKGKKPNIEPTNGTFICGGAIRQWFIGTESSSDIDVFGVSKESLSLFIKEKLNNAKPISENPTTKTFNYNGQLLQVIDGFLYKNIEETLDNFDFNICQFAYDGTNVYSTPDAIISTLRGHLGVHKISPSFAADSLRRAFKYQKRGYVPCNGTIKAIGESFLGLTAEQINNQVIISPNGGSRILRFD